MWNMVGDEVSAFCLENTALLIICANNNNYTFYLIIVIMIIVRVNNHVSCPVIEVKSTYLDFCRFAF